MASGTPLNTKQDSSSQGYWLVEGLGSLVSLPRATEPDQSVPDSREKEFQGPDESLSRIGGRGRRILSTDLVL